MVLHTATARPDCSRTPCVFSFKFFKVYFGNFFFKIRSYSNHILDQTTNYKRLHSIINPISGSNRWFFFSGRNGLLGASWEGPNKSSFNFYNNITGGVYFKKRSHTNEKLSQKSSICIIWGFSKVNSKVETNTQFKAKMYKLA